MISKIRVKNFKQIEDETIGLSSASVIVGPNNGGKTSLLQAVALFSIAIRKWAAERLEKKSKASKRTGVAISLSEMLNVPITEFSQIWKGLTVREADTNEAGKTIAKNIKIEIHAEGATLNKPWRVGFEFDYGRDNLIYARLTKDPKTDNLYEFPEIIVQEQIGYLPSISGLSMAEDKLERGSIFRAIGEGRTADVLRNICYQLYDKSNKSEWDKFRNEIFDSFRIELNPPAYNTVNGTLSMTYNEDGKRNMDLSCLGSGARQAILIFAYLQAFPNSVNLLDEPDAHLEVVKQSNIYDRISDFAKSNNSQIIIASHSESVLKTAYSKDTVVSSVLGKFKKQNDIKFLKNTLTELGYEQLLIAQQMKRVLYLEGSTDFDFLKAFAQKIEYREATDLLTNWVYFYPVVNDVNLAKKHFTTLKEFIPDLRGFGLFDNLRKDVHSGIDGLELRQWARNEIENYIPLPDTILSYVEANQLGGGPMYVNRFKEIVQQNTTPAAISNLGNGFWKNTKISDDYLTPIFEQFFIETSLPMGTMDKSKYYKLLDYTDASQIDDEVADVLVNIVAALG
jgi:AAA15 family ATPase/GTPase